MKTYDSDFEDFVNKLANMLFRKEVTPRDIYNTMMDVNNNDHDVAMNIKEKAMVLADHMYRASLPAVW